MPPRSLNSASKRKCHRSWSRWWWWWWWWYRIADTGTEVEVCTLCIAAQETNQGPAVGAIELDGEVSSGWESYLQALCFVVSNRSPGDLPWDRPWRRAMVRGSAFGSFHKRSYLISGVGGILSLSVTRSTFSPKTTLQSNKHLVFRLAFFRAADEASRRRLGAVNFLAISWR